jgi:hypothetical protein
VEGFIAWFEALQQTGPGQNDPLFPWIAEEATLDQLRWFMGQEAAGEAGFDDLVAMTQVKMPALPKLELARNYWDEMGRGNAKGMHGPMLQVLIETMAINADIDATVWESLALANAMTAMATTRRYAWHSISPPPRHCHRGRRADPPARRRALFRALPQGIVGLSASARRR